MTDYAYEMVDSDEHQVLSPTKVGRAVYAAIRECATTLRADFFNEVQQAYDASLKKSGNASTSGISDKQLASINDPDEFRQISVLRDIIKNAMIGSEQQMPICQDTGSVWICLEVGEENAIPGNIFSEVNHAVSQAYIEGKLRMSIVKNALFDRTNTNNNTPAFTEIHLVPGKSVRMHVMLKGGGSDNASRLVMLPPSAGKEGIKEEVLKCVHEKAANACPPLLIGVGVGSTFDKVAGLAKMALVRHIGQPAESDEAAEFEKELLYAVNATGIGPAALGGAPTAVGVHLKTAPCHIAVLPLAINMGCCAMRTATIELVDDNGTVLRVPAAQTWQHVKQ